MVPSTYLANVPIELRDRTAAIATNLAAHRDVQPSMMAEAAMQIAADWKAGKLLLDGDDAPVMVQPRRGKWIVFRLGDDEVLHTFQRLGGARARARVLAGELEVAFFVIGPAGSISDRVAAPKRKPEAAETKAEPKKAKVEPAKPAAKAKVEPAKPAAKAKAEPAKPAAKAKSEPAKPAAKAKAEPKRAEGGAGAKAQAEPAEPAG
jgi:hypothetical protein